MLPVAPGYTQQFHITKLNAFYIADTAFEVHQNNKQQIVVFKLF